MKRPALTLLTLVFCFVISGCAGDSSTADKHDAYVGVYGSNIETIAPYQHVDSNSFGKEFDVPGFVVKIVKDGDAYQMYYWLAEPDEFRLLEKTESGFTLNGESIYLSEDKNTLYIDSSNTKAIRYSEEDWRTIEPHAIMRSCSEHLRVLAGDRGLTTYGQLNAFASEYFTNYRTQVCKDNDQFYEDDIAAAN